MNATNSANRVAQNTTKTTLLHDCIHCNEHPQHLSHRFLVSVDTLAGYPNSGVFNFGAN